MSAPTSKPAIAEAAARAVRWLDSEHGLFLLGMAIVAGVLLALNGMVA